MDKEFPNCHRVAGREFRSATLLLKKGEFQMNKVVRFKGSSKFVPKEAGNLYIDEGKVVLIDEAGEEVILADNSEEAKEQEQQQAGQEQGDTASLLSRIEFLEQQIKSLSTKGATQVDTADNLNQPENDIVVSVSEPVTATTTVAGNSITVNDLNAENTNVKMTATADASISGFDTTGTLPKSTSNAQLALNANGNVGISDCEIAQNSYNAIEIGIASSPSSIRIDGVKFSGTYSNNILSFFDTQDGATITISNCEFGKCSNAIRLSNRSGGKVTLNIINCSFDQWDTSEYAGCIICQDYTNKSAAEAQAANLFSPDKVSINFINCTYKGEKIMVDDIAAVAGTKQPESQLIYVYVDKEGFIMYDADRYPAITTK